jgi:hypothetical protein
LVSVNWVASGNLNFLTTINALLSATFAGYSGRRDQYRGSV